MTLTIKPHLVTLLCSAGMLAASGVLYVHSRIPATVAEAPATPPAAPQSPSGHHHPEVARHPVYGAAVEHKNPSAVPVPAPQHYAPAFFYSAPVAPVVTVAPPRPSAGQQFTRSLVKGLGYGLGAATSWAVVSDIYGDNHHHHDDDHHDDDHHDDHHDNHHDDGHHDNHHDDHHDDHHDSQHSHGQPHATHHTPASHPNMAAHPAGELARRHPPQNSWRGEQHLAMFSHPGGRMHRR